MAGMKAPSGSRLALLATLATSIPLGACSSSSPATPGPDADASATDPMWCGRGTDVPGATAATGFCLKSFAQVAEARGIAFAPNGDLFVAAPSESAPGGASGGPG